VLLAIGTDPHEEHLVEAESVTVRKRPGSSSTKAVP
jgi:hypothetical protein